MSKATRVQGSEGISKKILLRAKYGFKLFVTGATPNSTRAVANIKAICDTYLTGKYSLEIVDVYKHEELAERDQLLALPMLLKTRPLPQRKMIGDLSNTPKILAALGIME